MKPYDTDDELEQALFALELEQPPRDLRAAILAATVYRAPATVKAWEIWAAGALCAVLVWFLLLIVRGGAIPAGTIDGYVRDALSVLAQPKLVFWAAVGAGAALWISQLNLTPAPGAARATRR